jgi:hypothetical protein
MEMKLLPGELTKQFFVAFGRSDVTPAMTTRSAAVGSKMATQTGKGNSHTEGF